MPAKITTSSVHGVDGYYSTWMFIHLLKGEVHETRLPPGHAWRVRQNQPIHEDAYWRYLPYGLDQRLTRLPPEYVRVIIGTDVAIMNARTRVVVDVLEDITD